MRNEVDTHTLSKQLGNSVRMIERCYSGLTATMAAERLAWGVRGPASAELLEWFALSCSTGSYQRSLETNHFQR